MYCLTVCVWETWLKWQNVSAIGKYGDVIARDPFKPWYTVADTAKWSRRNWGNGTAILHQINCDNCPKRHLFHTNNFYTKLYLETILCKIKTVAM